MILKDKITSLQVQAKLFRLECPEVSEIGFQILNIELNEFLELAKSLERTPQYSDVFNGLIFYRGYEDCNIFFSSEPVHPSTTYIPLSQEEPITI